jgi:SWIM zinc finger
VNQFSEEQITQLAPDPASLKAGRELANERKWVGFGRSERALWGEIKGSGKEPYRTQIDLQTVAFKCSCPSRKFPCKHGLGLLLIFAQKPDGIAKTTVEPAWVNEWIAKRATKNESVTPPKATPNLDEKKARDRQKRQAERMAKAQAGVAELDLWLRDLVRTGLLTLPDKSPKFFEQTAARMIDAQLGGLAARVRRFANISYSTGQDWQTKALENAAQLFLLTEAFKNLPQLPPLLQEDVRSLLGWSRATKELLDNPETEVVQDQWLVLGRTTELDDKITTQRNWLWGSKSGRVALVLNFAYQHAAIETPLLPGTVAEAELAFYGSVWPFRAAIKTYHATKPAFLPLTPMPHWAAAQQALAEIWLQQPWVEDLPQVVQHLTLQPTQAGWWLTDAAGCGLPISPKFDPQKQLKLLAQSGGQPLNMALVRSETGVLPLGIWTDNQYILL